MNDARILEPIRCPGCNHWARPEIAQIKGTVPDYIITRLQCSRCGYTYFSRETLSKTVYLKRYGSDQ